MTAQGWYQDPFGVHEHRWFSDGTPTSLVRDGAAETDDPPPAPEYAGRLVAAATRELPDGGDLRRADQAPAKRRDYVAAAWNTFRRYTW